MEFPVLFKNVSEGNAGHYIDEERESKIIGFVDPENSSYFGYILAGGKQYGASYNDIVKIAQDHGGKTIETENAKFIGDNGVSYTINISDGKLTISQYLKTIVDEKTSNVVVNAFCYEGASEGNQSIDLCVGETYYCYLRVTPREQNQKLGYSITNQTKNEFLITGIHDGRTYVFGDTGTITNGEFSFREGSTYTVNYISDSSKTGEITLSGVSALQEVEDNTYNINGGTLSGPTKTISLAIPNKSFTIYVHEKGLDSFTTNTLTLKASKGVTYTVNSYQNYYYTYGDITVSDSNKITISGNSNSNITPVKLAYGSKPSKFIIKNTGNSNISPKFLYPKSWGTAKFYNGPFNDSNWKLKEVTYNVSTSKGSSHYIEYNYLYFGDIITPGSTGDWDIKW